MSSSTSAVPAPPVPAPAGRAQGQAGSNPALSVDWTACDGRGLCVDLLPELLQADPWGYPQARTSAAVPPAQAGPGALAAVPASLEAHARHAVRLCPRLALRLSS